MAPPNSRRIEDWLALINNMNGAVGALRRAAPEVMKTFSEMAVAAPHGEALDGKTEELSGQKMASQVLAINGVFRATDSADRLAVAFEHRGLKAEQRDRGDHRLRVYPFSTTKG